MISIKNVKWLVNLADTKPLLFSIALLLCSITVLAMVIRNREIKVSELEFDIKLLQANHKREVDSISNACLAERIRLNSEVKATLNIIIEGYKEQLKEQKEINERINNTIKANNKIIRKSTLD